MPSFTPKAFAACIAEARLAGINQARDLLRNLGAVSAAVAAGAVAGLAEDAERELLAASRAADDEAKAKAERASGQETLA